MALKQSQLQQIPQRNKDLAFGYVKGIEKMNKSTIPSMIKYLCLIYLNQNKDEFDAKNTHKDIKIDGNKVTALGNSTISTYLRNVVSKGIHVWRFKCGRTSRYAFGDMIGIVSDNVMIFPLGSYFHAGNDKGTAYGFGTVGKLNKPNIPDINGRKYGCSCTINDVIEMRVDFNELSLSFNINDTDYGKAFDIKPGEYRAAITMFEFSWEKPISCFTLMSYQHIH